MLFTRNFSFRRSQQFMHYYTCPQMWNVITFKALNSGIIQNVSSHIHNILLVLLLVSDIQLAGVYFRSYLYLAKIMLGSN